MAEPEERRTGAGAGGLVLVGLAVAFHLALVAYFAPRVVLLSGIPVLTDVFGIEAYRAARTRLALDLFGQLSVYDPNVLAGARTGLSDPFDTKLFVLGVVGLARLGVDPTRAFNGMVLAGHAVLPLLAYAACRAWRLGRSAAALVIALWSGLWFFDGLCHYLWFSGRLPWLLASALVVLSTGLAQRVLTGGSPGWAGLAAGVGALAAVVHPVPALLGAAAVFGVAWRSTRLLAGRRLSLFGAGLGFLPVLLATTRSWTFGSSEPVAGIFDVGPVQILWDLLEVRGSGVHAPGAARTAVRTLCLVAGCIALYRAQGSGDRRWEPAAWVILPGLVLGYAGGLLPLPWPADPYPFVATAALAAAVPAASFLSEVEWAVLVRSGAPALRVALAASALVVVPRLVRTVATYVPELLPERVVRAPADRAVSALVGLNEPMPDRLAHEAPPPRLFDLGRWLSEQAPDRVLVDDAAVAAFLSLTTPVSVLGPIGERGSPGALADPTPFLASPPDPRALAEFIRHYAVGWVVSSRPWGPFDGPVPGLDPPASVFGYRVRRVQTVPSLFAEGGGEITRSSLGSIHVANASGPRVTLRYHHDPSLHCRPGCRVEAAAPGRGAFISVPNPPPAFELYAK